MKAWWNGSESEEGGPVLKRTEWMEKVEDVMAVELEPPEAV